MGIGDTSYVRMMTSYAADYSTISDYVPHGYGIWRKTPQSLAHKFANVRSMHPLLAMTPKGYFSAPPPSPLKEPFSFLVFLVTPWTAKEKEGLARTQWYQNHGSGYLTEHSTQPQTLGYSLADSPVGLLAWIYEKLHHWTDNYPWEDDESELCSTDPAQRY